MLFLGDDWAEAHHDIELQDDHGRVLARRRLPEGIAGIAALHALVGDYLGDDDEPGQVLVGIETDRGPWVQALLAAGYQVWAVNPVQAARYRERHTSSGRGLTPGMRMCWPRSSGSTGRITARWPVTPRSLSM